MSRLPAQFLEDRALRDAARDVFMADVDHARTTFSGTGIAGRVAGRIGDGAQDVFEVAKSNADDNRGILAMLIGAVLLFFAREPILEILGFGKPQAEDELLNDDAAESCAAISDDDEPVRDTVPETSTAGDSNE